MSAQEPLMLYCLLLSEAFAVSALTNSFSVSDIFSRVFGKMFILPTLKASDSLLVLALEADLDLLLLLSFLLKLPEYCLSLGLFLSLPKILFLNVISISTSKILTSINLHSSKFHLLKSSLF